ncbi:MAG: translational GTPase TypA [Proteobacteria bacterium]|nr:translational GTPase TypA [Pseudomonadota bacterium]
MKDIRNVAIIAHVDHGKTTMVDVMFQQSGAWRANQAVVKRAMDSNELERERGITILAKCTSIEWEGHRINIVDTPGHADFGGEVERILSMVDGVILLVDAAEGPMPQTKFVLMKALALGLCPILVINKADRPDARPHEVVNEVFDLFLSLDANEKQLEFPILYASAKEGWCVRDLADTKRENINPLFETVLKHVPTPNVDKDAPFKMLVTMLDVDPYLGRILTGRIESGVAKTQMGVRALAHDGSLIEDSKLTKVFAYRGLKREPIESAQAGDIIAVAGFEKATVSHTIGTPDITEPLKAQPIDPPTLSMTFSINDSPLAGKEGKSVTSRLLQERLMREAESNIAIQVRISEEKDAFEVSGRGELQLGVLIETMRREGFEMSVSRPRVVYRRDEATGERLEPFEDLQIDVDEEFSGVVMEKMGLRKGELTDMRPSGGGKIRLTFLVPSRSLIGYIGELLTDTRGTAIMSRLFHGYGPYKGALEGRRNGVLISNATGKAVGYALFNLEDRGVFFIEPGEEVYEGMIIGENNRNNDLEVNPLKAKQLSNVRASGKDDAIRLSPPRRLRLEEALSYIQDDELVEVTPSSLRLRKRLLLPHERKRASRQGDDS